MNEHAPSLEAPPAGEPLSLQQMFDKALAGLRRQGGTARDASGRSACVYRGADGTACGVGQLIPDNAYDDSFDFLDDNGDTSVIRLAHINDKFRAALDAGGIAYSDGRVLAFLSELQFAHDGADDLAGIESRMKKLALTYNLIYTPPTQEA